MVQVAHEKDAYLAAQAQFADENARAPAWLRRLRQDGAARFARLGFPGPRNEDWKFTPVAPLLRVPFRPAPEPGAVDAARLAEHALDGALRLVFVNGRFAPALSSADDPGRGVEVLSLAEALRGNASGVESHLGRHARHDEHPFIALNTGFLADGALVRIGKGVELDRPLQLVFASQGDGEPTFSCPRVLVVAEGASKLTLVEQYLGADADTYLTNGVTEVVVGEGAGVDHYKLVQEGPRAFHVGALQIRLAAGGTFTSHFITTGGGWVRNEARALLDGQRCECTLNGLYLATGRQHVDTHTVIDHARPHCASHELYKGILDGRAHGVFNGKIFVRPDAQKTDAKQTNQTLLLSDDAVIDTKPQLEIFADDVKCTHGATVGQLDADSIFYLRSRGIGLEAARALLTYAFANDIVQRIKVGAVRARLEEGLLRRQQLPGAEEIEETA